MQIENFKTLNDITIVKIFKFFQISEIKSICDFQRGNAVTR